VSLLRQVLVGFTSPWRLGVLVLKSLPWLQPKVSLCLGASVAGSWELFHTFWSPWATLLRPVTELRQTLAGAADLSHELPRSGLEPLSEPKAT
jgi:hypothetical protein